MHGYVDQPFGLLCHDGMSAILKVLWTKPHSITDPQAGIQKNLELKPLDRADFPMFPKLGDLVFLPILKPYGLVLDRFHVGHRTAFDEVKFDGYLEQLHEALTQV